MNPTPTHPYSTFYDDHSESISRHKNHPSEARQSESPPPDSHPIFQEITPAYSQDEEESFTRTCHDEKSIPIAMTLLPSGSPRLRDDHFLEGDVHLLEQIPSLSSKMTEKEGNVDAMIAINSPAEKEVDEKEKKPPESTLTGFCFSAYIKVFSFFLLRAPYQLMNAQDKKVKKPSITHLQFSLPL